METTLDWGVLAELPLKGRYPGLDKGRILFLVQNGAIKFPGRDFTVRSWHKITTVGWLNTQPPTFRVNVVGVNSKDGIPFCCPVDYHVQLKDDANWKHTAASAHESLYGTFELISKECAQSVFEAFSYSDIKQLTNSVRDTYSKAVAQTIESRTPYHLVTVVIDSVAALVPSVDEDLSTATITQVGHASAISIFAHETEIQQQRLEMQRATELQGLKHELSLQKEKDSAARESLGADAAIRREIQRIEADNRFEVAKRENREKLAFAEAVALIQDFGPDKLMTYLSLNDVDTYKELQKAQTTLSIRQADREIKLAELLGQVIMQNASGTAREESLGRLVEKLRLINANTSSLLLESQPKDDPEKL